MRMMSRKEQDAGDARKYQREIRTRGALQLRPGRRAALILADPHDKISRSTCKTGLLQVFESIVSLPLLLGAYSSDIYRSFTNRALRHIIHIKLLPLRDLSESY